MVSNLVPNGLLGSYYGPFCSDLMDDRERPMYAYVFDGRRYDVGDRLGFLRATVEFALKREDLREPFREYLEGLVRRLPVVMENGA